MDIGIGLPNAVAGTKGSDLIEFARRADAAGFKSLGTIDRLVYDNYEPLTALAAAAAVTERIRLVTTILLGPWRGNAALLAKQAATVHALSDGRLVLGIAIGAREDDYQASGQSMEGRGRRLDEMLDEAKRIWAGERFGDAEAIGPDVSSNPPQVILGGTVKASFQRAARFGDGWIMGGGSPDNFSEAREAVVSAWREGGREGEPRTMSLAYFSLGEDAQQNAERAFGRYYAFLGDELAAMMVDNAAKDEATIRERIQGFTEAGCDELILFPASSDPEQVDLLATAAL